MIHSMSLIEVAEYIVNMSMGQFVQLRFDEFTRITCTVKNIEIPRRNQNRYDEVNDFAHYLITMVCCAGGKADLLLYLLSQVAGSWPVMP